ncbi:MAG: ChaN family lipoprotein [Candidatus Omnitrophota bacterium]
MKVKTKKKIMSKKEVNFKNKVFWLIKRGVFIWVIFCTWLTSNFPPNYKDEAFDGYYHIYRRIKGFSQQKLLAHANFEMDYRKIIPASTQVVIFGEMHGNPLLGTANLSAKTELIKHMEEFKQMGFGYLGLEMFPADKQEILDRYFETPEYEVEANYHLEEEILQILKDFWGWAPEKYLELIQVVKKHGIRPIALHNGGERTSDFFLSEKISDFLMRNPEGRIMVFVGYSHLFNLGQYLERFAPFKIAFLGGANYRIFGKYDWTVIEQITKQAGFEDKRFLLKAEDVVSSLGYHPVMGADIYIHLPND